MRGLRGAGGRTRGIVWGLGGREVAAGSLGDLQPLGWPLPPLPKVWAHLGEQDNG